MREFKWVVEYIDSIEVGKRFQINDIIKHKKKDYYIINENLITQYISYFINIGIISFSYNLFTSEYDHYYKDENIPYSKYLKYDDLLKMVQDEKYIKIFERKCKIKLLKK